MIDFKAALNKMNSCQHKSVYFNEEHDNFYCRNCHKGMGNKFYTENIESAKRSPKQWEK
jgi:hypothetical protein